jgi:hypothetical protein
MVYGPDGDTMEFTPLFHVRGRTTFDGVLIFVVLFQTKPHLQTLQSLLNKIQESFVHEKPPHLLGNGNSSFHILMEHVWAGMSSTQVQEKLETGAIMIKNTTAPLFSFDRELFVDMLGHGNMRYVVPMEGDVLYQLKHFIFD